MKIKFNYKIFKKNHHIIKFISKILIKYYLHKDILMKILHKN
jgi:hypothetical protein